MAKEKRAKCVQKNLVFMASDVTEVEMNEMQVWYAWLMPGQLKLRLVSRNRYI